MNYAADLNHWFDAVQGQLSFGLFLNHLTKWDEIGIVSGEVTRPENRFTGKLAYDIGAWNIFCRFRFWDDVKDSNTGELANENGGFTADGTIGELNNLDAVTYHDSQIKWGFKENVCVYVGWNNILDEDPPILGQGTQYGSDGVNTNRAAYNVHGRSIYVGFRSNF